MAKEEKKLEEQAPQLPPGADQNQASNEQTPPALDPPVEEKSPSDWAKALLDEVKNAVGKISPQVPEPEKKPEPKVEEGPVEEPIRATDKTIPGGRYLVGGRLVNANGDPIKE